jgi:hypothetical protein
VALVVDVIDVTDIRRSEGGRRKILEVAVAAGGVYEARGWKGGSSCRAGSVGLADNERCVGPLLDLEGPDSRAEAIG